MRKSSTTRVKEVEWVWWQKSMGVVVSEKPCWVRGDKAELGQEARLGKARDSLEDITKQKEEGFAVGVTEERKETKFSEGGEGDGRHIYSYRFRGGKNSF
jgi:hypothetical protein